MVKGTNQSKLTYRPEIDGLRAVAVISVIIYHAQIIVFGRDWFTGGYVGVDIFFVISGYLISRIILRSLETTEGFSFRHFYERRARRILPMLFVVMLVSFPFAWNILLPTEFIEYCWSMISAIFFGSNFFFYSVTSEYGATDSLLKPFLNTWSLGIEEQFYIVFPILLVFAYKIRVMKRQLPWLMIAVLVMSLLYSEYLSARNPALNFYMPISRFWELLAGSILAYHEFKYGRFRVSALSRLLPLAGILMIVVSVVYFGHNTSHPGLITLLPVVGVSLVLAFGSENDPVGKILSSRLLVGIGLISYSLYLWHFPIMAFARVADSSITQLDKIGWILLTFVLSIISYFSIEKPLRYLKSLRGFMTTICVMLVITLGFSLGGQWRFGQQILFDQQAYITERANYFYEVCGEQLENCNNEKKYLIVGDSMTTDALNILLSVQNISWEDYGLGGCPPHDHMENLINPQVFSTYDECIALTEQRFNTDFSEYAGVVIMSRFEWYKPEHLVPYLDYLRESNVENVLLFGDLFGIDGGMHDLINKYQYDELVVNNINFLNYVEDEPLEQLADTYGFDFVSIKDPFRQGNSFRFFTDGVPIVWDYHHLTLNSAKIIGEYQEDKIKAFLSR